jgi:glutamine synthetase
MKAQMQNQTPQHSAAVVEARDRLLKAGVSYVRFEMSDIMGVPRSKTVPIEAFEGFAVNGVNMYGGTLGLDSSSLIVPNTGLAEEEGYRDAFLVPNLETLRILSWAPDEACVTCDPCWGADRAPLLQAPRYVLQRQLDKAASIGFDVISGHELEFYLLDATTRKPLFGGEHIFMSARNHHSDFLKHLMDQLRAMGFPLTTHNAEYAPSQFEINFAPALGMNGADTAFQFKSMVKEFARRNCLLATFMSKPSIHSAGSGYHMHMGLNLASSGVNAFNAHKGPDGLSDTALHFTAGILHHVQALTALMAPTINCYHRFKKTSFAPTRATWGIEDRTALVRVKASRDSATHVEMRGGAGMANPYLLQAGVLAAGLLGLENKLALNAPKPGLAENDTDAVVLPSSLSEALQMLEADTEFCSAIGPEFVQLFTKVKQFEVNRWLHHISDWETAEYLELY